MADTGRTAVDGPEARSLAEARRLAAGCQRCDLYRNATQTVFGEGPTSASVMLVGEQPGDREDIEGHPFVGPAGRVLDQVMAEAGLDRAQVYITNAVKHFKNTPRGKRRIHQRPNQGEIDICQWWLDLELRFLKPQVVVGLGASAARALFGRALAIGRHRGRPLAYREGIEGYVTIHPSYVLRQTSTDSRRREHMKLVEDLSLVADRINGPRSG